MGGRPEVEGLAGDAGRDARGADRARGGRGAGRSHVGQALSSLHLPARQKRQAEACPTSYEALGSQANPSHPRLRRREPVTQDSGLRHPDRCPGRVEGRAGDAGRDVAAPIVPVEVGSWPKSCRAGFSLPLRPSCPAKEGRLKPALRATEPLGSQANPSHPRLRRATSDTRQRPRHPGQVSGPRGRGGFDHIGSKSARQAFFLVTTSWLIRLWGFATAGVLTACRTRRARVWMLTEAGDAAGAGVSGWNWNWNWCRWRGYGRSTRGRGPRW